MHLSALETGQLAVRGVARMQAREADAAVAVAEEVGAQWCRL
jgi:hypothetical protein